MKLWVRATATGAGRQWWNVLRRWCNSSNHLRSVFLFWLFLVFLSSPAGSHCLSGGKKTKRKNSSMGNKVTPHSLLFVQPPDLEQFRGDPGVQKQSVHQIHVAFRDDIGHQPQLRFIFASIGIISIESLNERKFVVGKFDGKTCCPFYYSQLKQKERR